jgi:glycine cleavage system aminomethyltransferase T
MIGSNKFVFSNEMLWAAIQYYINTEMVQSDHRVKVTKVTASAASYGGEESWEIHIEPHEEEKKA